MTVAEAVLELAALAEDAARRGGRTAVEAEARLLKLADRFAANGEADLADAARKIADRLALTGARRVGPQEHGTIIPRERC